MERQTEKRADWGPPGKMITDGARAANEEVISRAGDAMLKDLSRLKRIALKRVPGLPGLVIDAVEYHKADDKGRKLAGMAGSLLGGLGGGALGAATGPAAPVAAPLGAAVGSVAGEHIAEEFYDDNKAAMAATKAWIARRNADAARAAERIISPIVPPPVRPLLR